MTTKRSSTQIILEAVQDLHAQEQVVTRETLHALTELKLSVIDDRVGALIDDGLVVRVQRGLCAGRDSPASQGDQQNTAARRHIED